jgi:hypothetical protein
MREPGSHSPIHAAARDIPKVDEAESLATRELLVDELIPTLGRVFHTSTAWEFDVAGRVN